MNLANPIELYFEETNYNQNLAMYESRIEHFQTVLDKIKLVVPSIVFAVDDLTPLFHNPKDFLASKIIKEQTIVGGVELNRTKVFELLSCADELKQIISDIESEKINPNTERLFLSKNTSYYLINESDLVEVKPQTLTDLVTVNTAYLKTEKQKKLYDSVKKIADAYNEIKESNFTNPSSIQSEFLIISNGGDITINHKSILRY